MLFKERLELLLDSLQNYYFLMLLGCYVTRDPSLPQQLLDISVMIISRLLVAKLGFSSSWPSISLPFSLVVTEHMAPFHIRTSDPPVHTHRPLPSKARRFNPKTRQQRRTPAVSPMNLLIVDIQEKMPRMRFSS